MEEEADFYERVEWNWDEDGFRARQALKSWFDDEDAPAEVDDVDREHYLDTIGG